MNTVTTNLASIAFQDFGKRCRSANGKFAAFLQPSLTQHNRGERISLDALLLYKWSRAASLATPISPFEIEAWRKLGIPVACPSLGDIVIAHLNDRELAGVYIRTDKMNNYTAILGVSPCGSITILRINPSASSNFQVTYRRLQAVMKTALSQHPKSCLGN